VQWSRDSVQQSSLRCYRRNECSNASTPPPRGEVWSSDPDPDGLVADDSKLLSQDRQRSISREIFANLSASPRLITNVTTSPNIMLQQLVRFLTAERHNLNTNVVARVEFQSCLSTKLLPQVFNLPAGISRTRALVVSWD
jgi:hypothetical protein